MRKLPANWTDYRRKSKQTSLNFRASKNNPYICDHCGYRTTRYGNMTKHLERMHSDLFTDPRTSQSLSSKAS